MPRQRHQPDLRAVKAFATYALSFAVAGSALVASSASCSGPQAGIAEFSSGGTTAAKSSGDDDDNGDSSGSSSSTSGAPQSTDQRIFGNNAFAYTAPAENADDHTTETHAGLVPMEGKGCVVTGCHLAGTTPWVAAGTVYNAATGGAFTGQAEIGIVAPDNTAISLVTDLQGNFWTPNGTAPPAGSIVGIRVSGQQTLLMAEPLPAPPASQNCNEATACHGKAGNNLYASLGSHYAVISTDAGRARPGSTCPCRRACRRATTAG